MLAVFNIFMYVCVESVSEINVLECVTVFCLEILKATFSIVFQK